MTQKPPPVPPDQQSHKGTGSGDRAPTDTTAHGKVAQVPKNLAEQDRQGNTKQNTTNQGHQQDR